MAIVFMDGFSHYDLTGQAAKYDTVSDPNSLISLGTTYGRLSGSGVRLGSQSVLTKIMPYVSTTGFILGVAVRFPSSFLNGTSSSYPIIRFNYAGSNVIDVSITRSGLLSFSYTGSVYGSSQATSALSADTWYHLEIKMTTGAPTAPPAHSNQIKVNGTVFSEVAAGNKITWGANSLNCDRIILGYSTAVTGYQVDMSDLYVLQQDGGVNGNYIGDMVVKTFYPSSIGTYSDFAVSGVSAASAVSEDPPDFDSSYISSSTSGAKSSFALTQLSGSPAISGVQLALLSKKVGTDAVSDAFLVLVSGGEQIPATFVPGTAYKYALACMDQNPVSLAAWSSDDVKSMEAGVKIVV
jgi:hypothetical protein